MTKLGSFLQVNKVFLKGIATFSSGNKEYLVAGDRKGYAYVLSINDDGQLVQQRKFFAHTDGISSVCYVESWKGYSFILTGSLDNYVHFWLVSDLISDEEEIYPVNKIKFNKNVSSIKQLAKGELCFITWDNTSTIIFENDSPNIILKHGSRAAWDLVKIDNRYISAEASGSVKIFNSNDGNLISEIEEVDTLPLRGIFHYKEHVYVTSNSGKIFKFSINDQNLVKENEYEITNAYLYTYCIESNKLYIGGDDRVVFVFDLDSFKTIDVIPVIGGVWGICFGSLSKDLFIATESGYVFNYTTNASKYAKEEVINDLLNILGKTVIQDSSISSIDMSEFPTEIKKEEESPGRFFAIYEKGEVKIKVYSSCFGGYVTVGAIENNKKVEAPDGTKYDESITVETDDGKMRELYLNYSEDVNEIATRFVKKYGLNERFIPQIVDFINLNLGDNFAKGKKVKKDSSGKFDCVEYGVAETQGRRPYMEDCNTIFELSNGKTVFCIFDGHGGDKAAIYAKENIKSFIEKNINSETFLSDALKEMNIKMVEMFKDSGSTAVIGCFSPTDHSFLVSNLGDSRAVLCSDEPVQLSIDHKITNKSEAEMVVKNGGTITDNRISGMLSLSRFLGDGNISCYSCNEPYNKEIKVNKGDKILLGSDGIFDFLSNEECTQLIKSSENPANAAIKVRDHSYDSGSADNLTAIVIEITK